MFLGLALCILGVLGGIWPPQISMKQTSFYIKFNILIISFVQETVPGVLFGQELFFFNKIFRLSFFSQNGYSN